jgi:PAS domain S-box-containing protein
VALNILLLEDTDTDAELLRDALRREGLDFQLTHAATRDDFTRALAQGSYDIILADFRLAGFGGSRALEEARRLAPETPFVVVSGAVGDDVIVDLLRAGAADFVPKHQLGRLGPAVRRAVQAAQERAARRGAEATLAESLRFTQSIIDASPSLVYVYDRAQSRSLFVNEEARRLGYGADQLQEMGSDLIARLMHPDDVARIAREREGLAGLPAHEALELEFRLRNARGEWRWFHAREVRFAGSGREHQVLGTAQDMTAAKRAEERVREQAALIEHAREAIVVTGLDHRVRLWNRGAERLYGVSEAEAVGQDAGRLFAGRNDDGLAEARARVQDAGEWAGLLEQRGRRGQWMKIQSQWTLVRDPTGTPQSILIINADVTERKQLEAELLRAQRMDSLGVLAGGIAHDLNNVLAPILMALDALKKRAADDRSLRMFQLLEASAQRGADLVRQILGFARGVEGQRLFLDPLHVVREIEKMVREALPMTVDLEIHAGPGLWHVMGDPTQLHQVLLNLCVNARDAMPEGGKLRVVVQNVEVDAPLGRMTPGARPGPHVLFRVTDTGGGIPADVLDRIFEPFFTTKEPGRGTGLGLSTAMTIVRAHDGFMTVTSEPGQGSTFDVYVPATLSDAHPAIADRVPELPRGNGEVVLVADDEVSIREIAKEALEACGYVPVLAVNGAEAVALCTARPDIAAVLMDVHMPVLDGNAAIRELQRSGHAVKVIAVSGFADHQPQALSSGACLFLTKPYTAAQLMNALRTALTS